MYNVEVVTLMKMSVEAVRSPSETNPLRSGLVLPRQEHSALRAAGEPLVRPGQKSTALRAGHGAVRDGDRDEGNLLMVSVPPATPTGQPSSEKGSSPRGGRHGLSIVIVEDNDDSRDMLQMLLESRGHEVLTARDGKEGADVIVEHQPDLALVDIGLPTMNGYDVARTVRAACPGAQIYMVALTGYGRQEDRDAVMAAGFDEHIVKPIEPSDLNRLAGKVSGQ